MKPFQLPAWRKRHIQDKYNRKNKVIRTFVLEMERVMNKAVDYILDHGLKSGQFVEPPLTQMFVVSEDFYRRVITESFHSAKYEKEDMEGRKRLARLPKGALPKSLKDIDQVFKDPKYWKRIMGRSKVLTERLKRQYLEKLKQSFKELMPKINSGAISPAEAKKAMIQTWDSSKARVETIFRTETTKYFAETQVKFFEGDPEIIGFMFDSIRDVARTEICRSRHGLIYRPDTKLLSENSPPCHFNCRSHLIALANSEHNRKLIKEKDRDPSRMKVVPLPDGWKS